MLRKVTTKPLNIRDLPVPSSTVSLLCDGAAQGMKDAVGTQGTVPLGDDTSCLEVTNPMHNRLFRERTDPGSFLSLQDSLQARKDVSDIPLPSSQCSLEFDKLRDNLPLPHFDLTSDLSWGRCSRERQAGKDFLSWHAGSSFITSSFPSGTSV